jgi:tetratricopeptide (TPR) repeat protein
MDWQIPLLVSAIAFAAFMIFKMRPALGDDGRANAAALKEAKQRIEAAKEDADKAKALCDAGDACASLGRANTAVGFYLRAFRADPRSKELVERAATALARRPRAVEKLMWRHLGNAPWTGDGRPSALAALKALAAVYARRPNHPRAKALEHAVEAFSQGQ